MYLAKVVCFGLRNTPFDAKHDLMTLHFYLTPFPKQIFGQKKSAHSICLLKSNIKIISYLLLWTTDEAKGAQSLRYQLIPLCNTHTCTDSRDSLITRHQFPTWHHSSTLTS